MQLAPNQAENNTWDAQCGGAMMQCNNTKWMFVHWELGPIKFPYIIVGRTRLHMVVYVTSTYVV